MNLSIWLELNPLLLTEFHKEEQAARLSLDEKVCWLFEKFNTTSQNLEEIIVVSSLLKKTDKTVREMTNVVGFGMVFVLACALGHQKSTSIRSIVAWMLFLGSTLVVSSVSDALLPLLVEVARSREIEGIIKTKTTLKRLAFFLLEIYMKEPEQAKAIAQKINLENIGEILKTSTLLIPPYSLHSVGKLSEDFSIVKEAVLQEDNDSLSRFLFGQEAFKGKEIYRELACGLAAIYQWNPEKAQSLAQQVDWENVKRILESFSSRQQVREFSQFFEIAMNETLQKNNELFCYTEL